MLKYVSMILEKLGLDSDSRTERKEKAIVSSRAEPLAEAMAFSDNPESSWCFTIGEAPKTMSVMEFAKAVGEAAVKGIENYTSMEIAEVDLTSTYTANVLTAGIGEEGIEAIPPPSRDVSIVFDRTPAGKIYQF